MKAAKCTSCGANIQIDESKKSGFCPNCGTAYTTDEIIKNYITNSSTTNAQIVNNYYGNNGQNSTTNIRVARTPRPRINGLIAFLGLCFYVIPGIIYIIFVKKQQKEWDDKYTF